MIFGLANIAGKNKNKQLYLTVVLILEIVRHCNLRRVIEMSSSKPIFSIQWELKACKGVQA